MNVGKCLITEVSLKKILYYYNYVIISKAQVERLSYLGIKGEKKNTDKSSNLRTVKPTILGDTVMVVS